MRRTTTKQSTVPVDVHDPGWIAGRIRAAAPVAVKLLSRGLGGDNMDLTEEVQAFSGDTEWINLQDKDEFVRIVRWIADSFAVGVAYGQRIQPGAFNAGGGGR